MLIMISLLRLVMSKAIKSIASGAVKFQKPFLSNSHLGSGEVVRIPRSESTLRNKSTDEERHMLNFQAKQRCQLSQWPELMVLVFWSVRLLKLLPLPNPTPFILCIHFHLPFFFACFQLLSLLSAIDLKVY